MRAHSESGFETRRFLMCCFSRQRWRVPGGCGETDVEVSPLGRRMSEVQGDAEILGAAMQGDFAMSLASFLCLAVGKSYLLDVNNTCTGMLESSVGIS